MTRTPVVQPHRTRQRGQAVAFIGIGMVVFTGMMVVGVDVARLAFTAAEVQSIADAAATAGALAHAKGAADPEAEAVQVIQANYVDARDGSLGAATTDVVKALTPGQYNFTTGAFTALAWTDPLTNAVRAEATARVDNLVAAVFGMLQSDVSREAIAATAGSCTQQVALPIAVELDAEIQSFLDDPNCADNAPTRLYQVPTDNSCWTSLQTGVGTSNTEVQDHIPTTCVGNGAGNTGGGESESVSIGQTIDLNNGQIAAALSTIEGCLSASPPLDNFVVPVVGDGTCSGRSSQVVSFARVYIDHVHANNSGTNVAPHIGHTMGVYIRGICREVLSGSNPGCTTGGELAMAIVK